MRDATLYCWICRRRKEDTSQGHRGSPEAGSALSKDTGPSVLHHKEPKSVHDPTEQGSRSPPREPPCLYFSPRGPVSSLGPEGL